MMTRAVLSFLSVLSVASAEPSQCAAARGGTCVEDEGALIQKAAQAMSGLESDVVLDSEGGIEFSMSEHDFANSTLLVPQKLKDAGLEVQEGFEDALTLFTASGSLLQSPPSKADFPLRLQYKPRAKPHPDSTSFTASQMDVDMAHLAAVTYDFAVPDPKCWKRELEGKIETWWQHWDLDHFTFHTCQCDYCKGEPDLTDGVNEKKVCAIGISGSNDGNDWMNNARFMKQGPFCGRKDYHSGFAQEAKDIAFSAEFEPFAEKIKDCDRIIFTGHSLGGAVASIFARCVNCRSKCGAKPPAFRNISVEAELYTVGAPAITKTSPLKNDLSQDGSFKGVRFYNYKRRCLWIFGCQDPVPWTLAKLMKKPYLHPKVMAVGLGMSGGIMGWNADNEETPTEPKSYMIHLFDEHKILPYINRMEMHKS